jgi:hypothetical protein
MADDPRSELGDRIQAIRERWRELVTDVGEERMQLPGPMGEWTFKDLASHLTAWRRRAIGRLEAAGRGEPPPPTPWSAELGDEETDAINAWIHERTKDDPLPTVLTDADGAYDALLAAVRALPLDAAGRELDSYIEAEAEDGHPYGHLGEHEGDVRRWLGALEDRRSGAPQ